MYNIKLDTTPAENLMAAMRQSLAEFARGEMKEAFLEWQVEELHRGTMDRPQPVVEEQTSVSVRTRKRRGRRPRRRRLRSALQIAAQRVKARLRRRVRRQFIAPTRLRRLRRQFMPRPAMVERRLRRLAGLPTPRRIRRRLGLRPTYLSPRVSEMLTNRMVRAMTGKLKWR